MVCLWSLRFRSTPATRIRQEGVAGHCMRQAPKAAPASLRERAICASAADPVLAKRLKEWTFEVEILERRFPKVADADREASAGIEIAVGLNRYERFARKAAVRCAARDEELERPCELYRDRTRNRPSIDQWTLREW